MDAIEFVRKWAAVSARENQASHSHFVDLCALLDEAAPLDADPYGTRYAFEKGAKIDGGDGWADVWQSMHFAWEYKGKGKHKDLNDAYKQIQRYREALNNPPLLVVCDIERYEVHTNWTNTESWIFRFRNADIATDDPVEVVTSSGAEVKDPPEFTARRVLKLLFEDTNALKPGRTRDEITREAAGFFQDISNALRALKTPDMEVAHFITRLVFCMFASDVGLLPRGAFSEVVKASNPERLRREGGDTKDPAPAFRRHLALLFEKMQTGGELHVYKVPYFNGSLFEDAHVPEGLTAHDIAIIEMLDDLDWTNVEPSIFGTLFERILDPRQRKPLGLHYTSRDDIELIVEPVLMEPFRREWREIKAAIEKIEDPKKGRRPSEETRKARIKALLVAFHRKLYTVKVLDPACGSGNFLYVSLALLKGLEKEVLALAAWHGVTIKHRVHPRQLSGIEKNAYAHELAAIVIWIGYLQWKKENAQSLTDETPILEALDRIAFQDAIVDLTKPARPREPDWPEADVIVGNPPFLGGKRLRTELGNDYVDRLFALYEGRVARESDLVCYWFEKARAQIEAGKAKRAGLLATQGIRGGANRKVLERIKETGDIFYAQADRRWVLDGAAVRVSMVGFDSGAETDRRIDTDTSDFPEGVSIEHRLMRTQLVPEINSNLTGAAADLTKARRLKENAGISFMGDTKIGPFDILAREARAMLQAQNPHGRPNSEVVRPWMNGSDITGRPRGMWIVDFPPGTSEQDAAKYEAPFEFVKGQVKRDRIKNARKVYRERWWIHGEPRPDMRAALAGLKRYIATARVTKHRTFAWVGEGVLCDSATFVFARSDDYFFGVLHSRVHEVWARATGTQLREAVSGFRYTPTTCFETFPFPRATKDQQRAIWLAAKEFDELREEWLNPQEMPTALGIGAKELAKRTLTELYNKRPTWLVDAHRKLDEAVFAAYGWREAPGGLPDAEIVARLLALNLAREAV